MAIAPKPKKEPPPPQIDEAQVNALIERGGSVATTTVPTAQLHGEKRISLRLPVEIARRLDRVVKARPLKIPQHTWLLEAVLEKLEREERQAK